jgi:hypothetical protein
MATSQTTTLEAPSAATGAQLVAARALMVVASNPPSVNNMPREEHAALMKELDLKRLAFRPPRRAWSASDCQPETDASQPPLSRGSTANASRTSTTTTTNNTTGGSPLAAIASTADLPPTRPRNDQRPMASPPTSPRLPENTSSQDAAAPRPRRPPLGPPRRSYSVMDYEPPPRTHRPNGNLALVELPSELHMAIFDWLDPIDCTCLGLTNKQFYQIHRRMHGTVSLAARRQGPNTMEWAWRGAGPLLERNKGAIPPILTVADPIRNPLESLRIRGQIYCRKCCTIRCELYRHLTEWMGPNYEYCEVRQKFGPIAQEGAKASCYMSSPRNPTRCGRHRNRPSMKPAA